MLQPLQPSLAKPHFCNSGVSGLAPPSMPSPPAPLGGTMQPMMRRGLTGLRNLMGFRNAPRPQMTPTPSRYPRGREWLGNPATMVDAEAGGAFTHPKTNPDIWDPVGKRWDFEAAAPNDGADAFGWESHRLEVGTKVDRFGSPRGKYVSPMGTAVSERAVPPIDDPSSTYRAYEVKKPFNVQKSGVAPAFNEEGGGIQYMTEQSVEDLVNDGYLQDITGVLEDVV